ncbi:hypothetical protein BKA70DRAFT_1109028 [Coprinopsis sp. MPI-PUGE-AT-0042]|nr:hypothetical protein BKA70DRAFT_1109028 [Coprinopsis sp. MPI-PUGE-AT-0042]
MISRFDNDSAYIATQWLLRQISQRGLRVEHLFKVTRVKHSVTTTHVVAILRDSSFLCDCMMPTNKGLPCRHFYAVLKRAPNVRLSLGHVRRRWFANKDLDISRISPVAANENEPRRSDVPMSAQTVPLSNPLERVQGPQATPPPATQTIPSREAYHEANASIRPIVNQIQTRQELEEFQRVLDDYQ